MAVASAADGPEHMPLGTSNGPIFLGSFSRVTSAARTMARVDGPPEPIMMPVRSLTTSLASRPASRIACSMDTKHQPTPASMKRRALRGTIASHSRFGAPCTWQRKPSSAYFSAKTMPDLASRNEASTSWVLLPIEDTIPIPVTTTRLIARPFLASSCRSSLCQTRTRRMTHPSQGCWLLAGCKEPDAKIGGSVDHLAVGLHHSVSNGKLQAAQDHPLQVDDVLHGLGCGHDHAGKLNLAHAQRPTLARCAEPAQKKAGELPERIEPEAARHHRVPLEMAGKKPIERGVARHLELGHHLTLAVRATRLRNPGNAIKHQHGGQRQLGIARAEQL